MAEITCPEEHRKDLGPDDIYCLDDRTVAQRGLQAYRKLEFCRRDMVRLAAQENLNLQKDFITKREIDRRNREGEVRLQAFAEVVALVKAKKLIPDVGGRPPWLGNKPLCRLCADPFSSVDLYVLDNRFLRWMHSDLTKASTDPETVLQNKAFCVKCFNKLKEEISQIASAHQLGHLMRWEKGRTHHTLDYVLSRSAQLKGARGIREGFSA